MRHRAAFKRSLDFFFFFFFPCAGAGELAYGKRIVFYYGKIEDTTFRDESAKRHVKWHPPATGILLDFRVQLFLSPFDEHFSWDGFTSEAWSGMKLRLRPSYIFE